MRLVTVAVFLVGSALARVCRLREQVTLAAGVVEPPVAMLEADGALDQRAQRMAQDIPSAAARSRT